jgi:hypothetical protein
LRGTLRGVRVRESCGTDVESVAEEIRAKREWEILQGSVHGIKAGGTFLAGVAIYLENGGERDSCNRSSTISDRRRSQIDQAAVDAPPKTIYPGLAPATLARQIYTPVSAVIKQGRRARPLLADQAQAPKTAKGPGALDHARRGARADRGVRAASQAARRLPVLHRRPHRRGAMAGLAQRRFARAQVQFLDTKNGRDRGVPLHPRSRRDPGQPAASRRLRFPQARPPAEIHAAQFQQRRARSCRAASASLSPLDPDDPLDVSAGSRIKKGFKAACTRAGITDFRRTIAGTPGRRGTIRKTAISTC